jgi:hypothetical protein
LNAVNQIRTAIVLLYSLGIIATATPTFGDVPNIVVLVYYLFVPGYVVVLYFNEDYAILQKLLFSVLIGLAIVLVIFSLRQTTGDSFPLPYDVIIPVVTIVLILFNYNRERTRIS